MRIFGKSEKHVSVSITTETIIKAIVLGVLSIIALRLIGKIGHQLTLISISAFLALALNPVVSKLTHKLPSKSRPRATAVAYLAVLSVLSAFLLLVVPPLVRQTSDFIEDVPQTLQDVKTEDSALGRTIRRYDLDDQVEKLAEDFGERNGNLGGAVFSTANRVGGTVVSIITVLVLTFMMLIEGPLWFERLLALQPAAKRERLRELARRMYKVVTGYVNGQVLIAAIAAAFTLVALLIGNAVFDASVNAVAMSAIAFVLGLVPMFGNVMAAAIIVLVTLFSSPAMALAMAIYFLIYQQIENATLQPYIQARSNQLTPLTVFVAALIGVGLAGILGALAAIPVAGCLRILAEEHFNRKMPSLETVEESLNK